VERIEGLLGMKTEDLVERNKVAIDAESCGLAVRRKYEV
jgi:hypothetical protein